MIAYQKEKLENAICFFALRHQERTRKPLAQTFLYKYLAFLDFESLEETGHPVLGLEYLAMGKGPVPIRIYDKRRTLKTECFEFKEVEKDKFIIVAKGRPNLEFFSRYEIKKMQRLIEIYADVFVRASDISEASHQAIRAWRKAYKRKKNSPIEYDLQFEEDISLRNPKDLTPAEESFLINKSIEEASN